MVANSIVFYWCELYQFMQLLNVQRSMCICVCQKANASNANKVYIHLF